jgi:serine/threonine protein kinase
LKISGFSFLKFQGNPKNGKGEEKMNLERIVNLKLSDLELLSDHGGQGTVYLYPNNKLIKIYPASIETSQRLEKIGNHGEIYRGLEDFCAIPEALVENEGKLIGFRMTHFQEFESISALNNVMFCLNNKITIRKVIFTFLTFHRLLSQIHSNGFLIIDLNDENVLIKIIDGRIMSVTFIDVDSWTIKRPEITLPPSEKTEAFCHPELETKKTDLQPYHDWYSYAVLLARSLIKDDPFNVGILNDPALISGTTRQKKGISCWDKRVDIREGDDIFVRRFGAELTNTLHSWLSGNQKGVFPVGVLHNFLNGLIMCRGTRKDGKMCNLEVHVDHEVCPRCGTKLPMPEPQTINPRNRPQKDDSGIVSLLLANSR